MSVGLKYSIPVKEILIREGIDKEDMREIQKALKIAEREWENIRASLELCGDVGELQLNNYPVDKLTSYDLLLIKNLLDMDRKLSIHGYLTQEAAYVFKILTTKAGKRLGLSGKLARAFGSGYSWVRTGWFDPSMKKQDIIKQLFFFKIFFPVGGYFDWDFNSSVVKAKFKLAFSKFIEWQKCPGGYVKDIKECKGQLKPICRDLDCIYLLL